MLMGLANLDGSFTGTVYMPSKGNVDAFEALNTREKAVRAQPATYHCTPSLHPDQRPVQRSPPPHLCHGYEARAC